MPEIYTLDDLATLSEQEREVFVKGLLNEGQIAVLVGQQKAGKSYLLDQLLMHIAAGKDWSNTLEIPIARSALVVQTEGSKFDLEERTQHLYARMPEAQKLWASYIPDVLDLNKGDGINELLAVMDDVEPDVVGFDSLYTTMSGSVRSDTDITAVKLNIRKLQVRHPKCSFIILHHEHREKRTNAGELYEQTKDRYAGSYQIMAMADISWHLTKDSNQAGEVRYFEVANIRSRHMGVDPFFLNMDDETGILSAQEYNLSDPIMALRLHLKAKQMELKDDFMNWALEEKEMKKPSVYRNLKKLVDAKHVQEVTDTEGKKHLEWIGE